MTYRIGVDVGGTFTDLVIAEKQTLMGRYKSPTTPGDLSVGVLAALSLASEGIGRPLDEVLADTDVIVHGSTIATNVVLEGKGVKTGVICTEGTKYTLWKAEGRRQDVFSYKREVPVPLVRPYLCLEIGERIWRNGQVLKPLDEESVVRAIEQLREWDVKQIAVCLLWAFANPAHEERVGEIIRETWPSADYTLSHAVLPVMREYPRMSCTVLNCMVKPYVSDYLGGIESALQRAGFGGELLITVSDGGVRPVREVIDKPVYMLFSGPAMGPIGGMHFALLENESNAIVADMGGTSFDVSSVIDGRISTTRQGRVRQYPTGVAATEILTLGAGGGSIARVDDAGMLFVGPESAGAAPGPACYDAGGTRPTVTDACVCLGYILPDRFLNGRMLLSEEKARSAVDEFVARPLGITVERAASGIFDVVNENMVSGILEMTLRRGIDPREMALITGGGATGLSAARLGKEMGVSKVLIPRESSVLCAFGALNADVTTTSLASKFTDSRSFDYAGVNAALEQLVNAGNGFLSQIDAPRKSRKIEMFVAARYPDQITELDVPVEYAPVDETLMNGLVQKFHAAHLLRYKTNQEDAAVQFVLWRSIAKSITDKIKLGATDESTGDAKESAAFLQKRRAYFAESGGFVDSDIFDGELLKVGQEVCGPAVVCMADTTIVVPPMFRMAVSPQGYFIMFPPAQAVDPVCQQPSERLGVA
jgi:N-methylhydantoinase A